MCLTGLSPLALAKHPDQPRIIGTWSRLLDVGTPPSRAARDGETSAGRAAETY
jgi:hypothetical protein